MAAAGGAAPEVEYEFVDFPEGELGDKLKAVAPKLIQYSRLYVRAKNFLQQIGDELRDTFKDRKTMRDEDSLKMLRGILLQGYSDAQKAAYFKKFPARKKGEPDDGYDAERKLKRDVQQLLSKQASAVVDHCFPPPVVKAVKRARKDKESDESAPASEPDGEPDDGEIPSSPTSSACFSLPFPSPPFPQTWRSRAPSRALHLSSSLTLTVTTMMVTTMRTTPSRLQWASPSRHRRARAPAPSRRPR